MFEKNILQLLHLINIEHLECQKKDEFYVFFQSIIKTSHIFIKLAYYFLLIILIIFLIFFKLFFLSKNFQFFLFKNLILFFKKVYFLRDIIKFIKIYSIIYNYD